MYLIFCALTNGDKPEKCTTIQLSPAPPRQKAPQTRQPNPQFRVRVGEDSHSPAQDTDEAVRPARECSSRGLTMHFIQLWEESKRLLPAICVKNRGKPNEKSFRASRLPGHSSILSPHPSPGPRGSPPHSEACLPHCYGTGCLGLVREL